MTPSLSMTRLIGLIGANILASYQGDAAIPGEFDGIQGNDAVANRTDRATGTGNAAEPDRAS
jgi:hypothetical protein